MTRRLTVAAFAAVALLAACGGSSKSTSAAAPTTATPSASAAAGTTAAAGGDTSTTVAGGGGAQRAELQAWQDCLSQHGVTLPSIPAGGGGRRNGGTGTTIAGAPAVAPPPAAGANGGTPPSIDPNNPNAGPGGFGGFGQVLQDPANQAAVQACASLQPQGGFGAGAGAGGGQRGQAFQAYLSCLKDHGVEVPTTVAGGAGGPPNVSIDPATPGFAEAQQVCQALLPQRGNGSTTTSTTAA